MSEKLRGMALTALMTLVGISTYLVLIYMTARSPYWTDAWVYHLVPLAVVVDVVAYGLIHTAIDTLEGRDRILYEDAMFDDDKTEWPEEVEK